MEERTNVEKVEVERVDVDRVEVPTVDIPTEELETKPSLLKRGTGWIKRNGPKILKGTGLVLAGLAVGVFVGLACACKQGNGEVFDDYGEDNGYEPTGEDEDECIDADYDEDSSDYESTEEES